ncbi:hypothetical protein Hanom_Chr14g01275801 [Helianthus anomalus]
MFTNINEPTQPLFMFVHLLNERTHTNLPPNSSQIVRCTCGSFAALSYYVSSGKKGTKKSTGNYKLRNIKQYTLYIQFTVYKVIRSSIPAIVNSFIDIVNFDHIDKEDDPFKVDLQS